MLFIVASLFEARRLGGVADDAWWTLGIYMRCRVVGGCRARSSCVHMVKAFGGTAASLKVGGPWAVGEAVPSQFAGSTSDSRQQNSRRTPAAGRSGRWCDGLHLLVP